MPLCNVIIHREEADKQLLQGGLGVNLGGLAGLNVGLGAGRKLAEQE